MASQGNADAGGICVWLAPTVIDFDSLENVHKL